MTGNGSFDAHTGGSNYGESFVKLRLEGTQLVVKDYFTPCNAEFLNSLDMDLGSAGPVLIPGALVVGGGKEGRLYLLSTARMGKYVAPLQPRAQTCANPNVLQDLPAVLGHVHGSPVFWQGPDGARLYVWSENDRLRAFRFANRRIVPGPKLSQYQPPQGMPGGMLALSSKGRSNGILWAVVPLDGDANKFRGVKGIVLALDAQDVSKTLWTSEQSGARDRLGLFARFVPPTIAGGKVFVATYGDEEPLRMFGTTVRPKSFPTRYQVVVYGVLPERPTPVVNQSREDVQLVRAAVEGAATVDTTRCHQGLGQTLDCTDELGRSASAPSLERISVPAGYNFAGCQLLRVTTASKTAALGSALGIGFYAAQTTAGQFSVDQGRLVPDSALKKVGDGVLKNGEPATLHEFVALVNCQVTPGTSAGKLLKPYIDFLGGPPRTIYRNWESIAGNYELPGQTGQIDRRSEVLR